MIKLSEDSLKILRECLRRQRAELLPLIEDSTISEFTPEFYNMIREIVGDEFIERGLNVDDEPNEYGVRLESLIDEIGRLFLYD